MGSVGFSGMGGIGLGTGCANTEECWPPPNTDMDAVPPNTELVGKELVADTRVENAFFGGGTC